MKLRPRGRCSLLNPLFFPAILLVLGASLHAQDAPPNRDPKLPVEERVADLLSRMTLEEKVAQLESAWENREFFPDERVFFVYEKGAFGDMVGGNSVDAIEPKLEVVTR